LRCKESAFIETCIRKARERLRSAKKAFEDGFFDASVSNSYYAMFYMAKAYLALKGSFPRTHKGLISEFGRLIVKKGEIESKYGEILTKNEALRRIADYEPLREIRRKEAERTLLDAKVFLEEIEAKLET
jgi:uncharacterized protein (UPF0332 family)